LLLHPYPPKVKKPLTGKKRSHQSRAIASKFVAA
jgi:hypothetical protein